MARKTTEDLKKQIEKLQKRAKAQEEKELCQIGKLYKQLVEEREKKTYSNNDIIKYLKGQIEKLKKQQEYNNGQPMKFNQGQ